jgi:hypothetical protein
MRTRGIVLVAVTVALAGGGSALALRARERGVPRYASTADMAARAGCTASFEHLVAHAGVLDAGRCRLAGTVVELRVLAGTDAAYAWLDGRQSVGPRGHGVVGDGWVAFTTGVGAARALAPLTG